MSPASRPAARRIPPVYLVGWLFADLLLVLALTVLGGEVPPRSAPVAHPTPTASPSASPSQSPSPSPSPSAPPPRLGLDPNSTSRRYSVDPYAVENGDTATLENDVLGDIRSDFPGKSTLLVIVWGTGANPNDSAGGRRLADAVAPLLTGWDPDFFPQYSADIIRAYWDGDQQPDTVRLELFFIQQ